MPSEVFVVGLSWRTAQVSVREQLAFREDELAPALADLTSGAGIAEAVLLSTCNRVEIYGCTERAAPASAVGAAAAAARSFFARSRRVSTDTLADAIYERTDDDAVRHIFRVASALDSMVLGESQILGQLKSAYGAAVNAGSTGPVLGRCVERAFGVAKRVRSETGVSRGAANVSSVAVELARRVFGELSGKHVLVVGAGKMSVLAARHLRAGGAGSITVTNRSPERAAELAAEIEAAARPWDELEHLVAASDVVISSTGSPEPVLTKALMKKALKRRRYRPLVIVDIAVPRDADPALAKLDGCYLFDIDDLQRVVAQNLEERRREAEAAERIIEHEVEQFAAWMRQQQVVPTIRALRQHFHGVAAAEAEKVIRLLERETSADAREQAVRRLGTLIVNKLLHAPMTALKNGDGRDVESLVAAANKLFELDGDGAADTGERPAPTRALAAERERSEEVS